MNTTLERKDSWRDRLSDQWNALKPLALVLALGLVAGPLISNYMGWQVTSGFAERQRLASAVEQQAKICAAFARDENPNVAALEWGARRALAEKHAIMPGRQEADSGVIMACSEYLTRT